MEESTKSRTEELVQKSYEDTTAIGKGRTDLILQVIKVKKYSIDTYNGFNYFTKPFTAKNDDTFIEEYILAGLADDWKIVVIDFKGGKEEN